jgi:hypothetical protein
MRENLPQIINVTRMPSERSPIFEEITNIRFADLRSKFVQNRWYDFGVTAGGGNVMKLTIVSFITSVILLFLITACNNEKQVSTLSGKWSGTKAEFQIELIRIPLNELNMGLDFKNHGKLIYTNNTQVISGGYSKQGKKLIISQIDDAALPVNLSGDYEIRELSSTQLILEGQRYGDIQDATYGKVSGMAKVLLFFHRSNP